MAEGHHLAMEVDQHVVRVLVFGHPMMSGQLAPGQHLNVEAQVGVVRAFARDERLGEQSSPSTVTCNPVNTAQGSTISGVHGSSPKRSSVPRPRRMCGPAAASGLRPSMTGTESPVHPRRCTVARRSPERTASSLGARQKRPTPAGSSLASRDSSQPEPPRSRSLEKSSTRGRYRGRSPRPPG